MDFKKLVKVQDSSDLNITEAQVREAVTSNWSRLQDLEPDVNEEIIDIEGNGIVLSCSEAYQDSDYETGEDIKESQYCTALWAKLYDEEASIWIIADEVEGIPDFMIDRFVKVICNLLNKFSE